MHGDIVMKKTAKQVVSIFCCSLLMSGTSAPVFAQTMRGNIGGAGVHAPIGGALSAVPTAISPAFNGGVSSIQGTLAPTLLAPSAILTPALSAPIALVPAQALIPVAPLAAASKADQPVNALGTAKTLAAAIGDENLPKGPDQAKEAADKAFDGTASNGAVEGEDASVPFATNGAPLAQLYPRVVFVQDVFSGPASEKTVEYVNKLVDAGVHVVFLTWRPHRGADSADSILMARVKQSRGATWYMSFPPLTWTTGTFGDNFAFNCSAFDHPDLDPASLKDFPITAAQSFNDGWVFRDGQMAKLKSVRKLTLRDPITGCPQSHMMEMVDANNREYLIRGTTVAGLPFSFWPNCMTHLCMTRWECEGLTGWGEAQEVQWSDYMRKFTKAHD